jgi:hypothetical protein
MVENGAYVYMGIFCVALYVASNALLCDAMPTSIPNAADANARCMNK